MAFRYRRSSPTLSGVALILALLVVSGWSLLRARRFSGACAKIPAGTPVGEAEAVLQRHGGRKVILAQPPPNTVEYRFNALGAPDRTCTVKYSDDGAVEKTSGASSVRL